MGRAPKNAFGCTLLLYLLVAIPSTATSRPEARDSHQEESTKAQSQDKEEKKEDKEKKRFIYWDEGLHIIGLKHLSAMKIGGSVQNDSAGFANSKDVDTTLGSPDGDVEWRRARLYASGTFLRHFDYKFQYDFAVSNPPQLKDAFLILSACRFRSRSGPDGSRTLSDSNWLRAATTSRSSNAAW